MSLGRITIGIVLFSMTFAGLMLVFDDMSLTYSPNVSDTFINATGQFGENDLYALRNQTNDVANKGMGFDNTSIDPTTTTPENLFWQNSFSTLKIIPQSFGIIYKVCSNMASYVGIPTFFVVGAMTILIIIIVFTIISAVLRGSIL